ncbi:MAG TPA: MFS transporter, partial [Acidimicrobiia bacterium]|nr:MFS transporter [Acidimicrobiia bacterium]
MTSVAIRPVLNGPSLQTRRRSPALGLAAICLGFLMITLDATIVNVALGPITAELGGSLAAAQWIVNGYTLGFASLLLTAGALADRVGARTGFVIGVGVFAFGSATCSAAVSLPMLIASRLLQGLGAAWLMPCSLALIAHAFPKAQERRRALAIWGGVSGIGLASGPVLGGVLTSAISWRAIFLVNVPVAAIAGRLLVRHVQETSRHRQPLDVPGQILAIAGLSLLTAGFVVAGEDGWGSGLALALLAGGAASALAFAAAERLAANPMVDPALFRSRTFSVSVTIGMIFNFCLYGSLFCLAIDMHMTHGLDALGTGLAMLPVTLVTGTAAFLSGRAVTRFGEWPVMLAGLAAGILAAVLVALNGTHGPLWVLIGSSLPLGATALVMPAMTAVGIGSAPEHRIGLASGVLNAARQTGGALGVAVLGALLVEGGNHVSLRLAFAVIAGAYIAGALLTLAGRR